MTDAAACRRKAKRLGCTLEVNRKSRHVTIWLPAGKQVEGNTGLDCLCRSGETLDDVWPWIAEDLKTLDGGMEPLVELP
jgi:hypothetical protein